MHPIQNRWKMVLNKTSVIGLFPVMATSKAGSATELNMIEVSSSDDHFLALMSDGTVMAMGCNQDNQLGNTTMVTEQAAHLVVTSEEGRFLSNIKAIAAGDFHNLALDDRGQVWAWGDHRAGQLGIGCMNDTDHMKTATRVAFPQDVNIVGISAGAAFSLALDDQGHVWAWGDNEEGQLGIGYHNNGESQHNPIQVTTADGVLNDIQSISAGQYHSLALDKDGRIWGWGANWNGALGFDETIHLESIVEEILLSWGNEVSFNLGEVVRTDHFYTLMDYMTEYYKDEMIWNFAKPMTNAGDVFSEVFTGNMQSQAMKADGSVWAWGYVEDQMNDVGKYLNYEIIEFRADISTGVEAFDQSLLGHTLISNGSKWSLTLCENSTPYLPIKLDEIIKFHMITGEGFFMICRGSYDSEWSLQNNHINYEAISI
ncbi:hypothetical protein MNQ98_28635 [Paenibacillus sp. N3/727]|uniref:RCC1 domain-containing protein n=1 Tax=Paenibacillus sp. N3/727 TaxID=2925845 RepID=UPI001F53BD4B|nr:hypothetical protein [Paenibacillus sp. N3/727]UNK18325.1 hypothetical protein MNQ98_28635 [Paenibacillus sp. N3/727]